MAHEVHTTDTIVFASADVQDADKLFWLLTEDFGLIFASAKSVREEVSKLRYSLQDLTLTEVSLVRGKGMWRITGADSQAYEHALTTDMMVVFGRIAALIRRVVPTDEVVHDVYDVTKEAFLALIKSEMPAEHIEVLAVARLLYRLGYVSREPLFTELLTDITYTEEVARACSPDAVSALVNAINTGLAESQL